MPIIMAADINLLLGIDILFFYFDIELVYTSGNRRCIGFYRCGFPRRSWAMVVFDCYSYNKYKIYR